MGVKVCLVSRVKELVKEFSSGYERVNVRVGR